MIAAPAEPVAPPSKYDPGKGYAFFETRGVVCTLLALVLVLPIPLGNLAPGATVAVLALALLQRDGILALLGYLMAVGSGALLFVSAHVVVLGARKLLGVFSGLF